MQIQFGRFELRSLRGSFQVDFDHWDIASEQGDRKRIRSVRDNIWAGARSQLTGPVTVLPGFYVFADTALRDMRSIVYVGIAETTRRPIANRIVDRIMDDSGLDVRLDELSDELFRTKVHRRLTAALPQSGHNYVEKHLQAAKLFRRSSHALIAGIDAKRELIRATEKVLVGAASFAGAELTNRHYLSFRGPCEPEAKHLAKRVLVSFSGELTPEVLSAWSSAIDALR